MTLLLFLLSPAWNYQLPRENFSYMDSYVWTLKSHLELSLLKHRSLNTGSLGHSGYTFANCKFELRPRSWDSWFC